MLFTVVRQADVTVICSLCAMIIVILVCAMQVGHRSRD
jgi:hypothetical protein